jgi:membrane-bound metal-dependent hydrolase YbcI (DUF457 family)
MTPVGHSLVGASLAVAVMPVAAGRWTRLLAVAAFAVLANMPDARLPGWGHDRYDISHSLFIGLGLILPLCGVFLFIPRARRFVGGAGVVVGGATAWLSHLLLDSCYNHGRGVAMFWPFSKASLALPIPWLDNVHYPLPYFSLHTAHVMGVELLTFGSVLGLACLGRRVLRRGPKTISASPGLDG